MTCPCHAPMLPMLPPQKPQNVLLGVTPSPPAGASGVIVKIADFGLSRGFVAEPAESAHTDWVGNRFGAEAGVEVRAL